jgi:mRNA interferase MazF
VPPVASALDATWRARASRGILRPVRIDRGDIYWVQPDDSRGALPSYAHPHVVVQEDLFNHSRIATVIVCALTSNLNRAKDPGNVLLEVGEGNLPKQSVVVVSQIDSVDRSRLGERIGALSAERVEQILNGLQFLQRSFFDGR